MASQEFIPKNNISPEGSYQRSIDIITYSLTRDETIEIITQLSNLFALMVLLLVVFVFS